MTKSDSGRKEKSEGTLDNVKGKVKEKVGEWTDNPKLEAKGIWEQTKGSVKKGVGQVKETWHEKEKNKQ
ncbi:CsbD family protein [Bacillus thuringiensis]|uniref:CsbD family protein n=1 Tax=Bacillus thuringiensis TaxID=1428 RepID=UPI00300DBFCB